MSVIDLDQPADRPAHDERQPASRRRVTGVAVVALLIGAVLGGLTVQLRNAQQARTAGGRQVSVLLFADHSAGSGAVDRVVNGDGFVQVTFRAAVAVVNAGPRPVELLSLAAQKPGLSVAGVARPEWISPGTSLTIDVEITAGCTIQKVDGGTGATIGGGILPATASVRTAGGSASTVSLSLDTGMWMTQFPTAVERCLHPQR